MLDSTALPDQQETKQDLHAAEEEMSGKPPVESVQEQRIPDTRLIKDAQAGNPEAFGELYERHAPTVYRFLNAHLDDVFDVEDLTNEVFLKAWRALPRYQEHGLPIAAFFLRIAHNTLIDYYRSRRNKGASLELKEDLAAGDAVDPGQQVTVSQEGQELRARLGLLKAEYRTVLAARFLGGFSPQETAQALGKSVGAVRVIQHRALAVLRKLLV